MSAATRGGYCARAQAITPKDGDTCAWCDHSFSGAHLDVYRWEWDYAEMRYRWTEGN